MKKIILLMFVAIIATSFVACEKDDIKKDNDSQDITSYVDEETTEQESTEIITDNVEIVRDVTFRNAVWGDSTEQVKATETADFIYGNEDALLFEGNLLGYDCDILYQFDNGALYNGGYMFPDLYTNAGQYIAAYDSIKKTLYEKYGDSIEDDVIELQSTDLIEMAGPANALKYGYVAYRAKWKTEETDITLAMMSSNYEITLLLSYQDINYVDENSLDGI